MLHYFKGSNHQPLYTVMNITQSDGILQFAQKLGSLSVENAIISFLRNIHLTLTLRQVL